MNEKLLKRQIECYKEYLRLLEVAKEAIQDFNGKTFTKRVLTKIEKVAQDKALPLHIFQDTLYTRENGGKVSIGVINRNRLVDNYYLSDYQFNFYICFSTNKVIDTNSTIENIEARAESMRNSIEKLKSTMEQYEALRESKKQLEELIAIHNAKVHYLLNELRIK